MKVAVGVTTRNIFENNRVDLFEKTIASLKDNAGYPFLFHIVDNNSSDETGKYVLERARAIGAQAFVPPKTVGANHTCGRGINMSVDFALSATPDLVVRSDDDIEWQPGWLVKIVSFWQGVEKKGTDIKLAGGHLESEFAYWSAILGKYEAGGVRAILRESTGAATWHFPAKNWWRIGPVDETYMRGADVAACKRLLSGGHFVAQLDLATHLGEGRSTCGNNIDQKRYKPLDRKKFGFT